MTAGEPGVRRGLRHHLALIIGIKVLALSLLWWFFFRGELRPPADSDAVANKVLTEQRETSHD